MLPVPDARNGTRNGSMPTHFTTPWVWMVAWKPWVLLHALRDHPMVLWMDANLELRRPVDSVHELLARQGYLFTTAGHLFPTAKTVRPTTLARAGQGGCLGVPQASRVEFTSALMGVRRGSWAHHEVLEPMHECCLDRDCVWPPDARDNTNQRRDQSVLNAVLCARDERASQSVTAGTCELAVGEDGAGGVRPQEPPTLVSVDQSFGWGGGVHGDAVNCLRDKAWWGWAGQATVMPPAEATAWSDDVVFFSRRADPQKPFVPWVEVERRVAT